jgi:hypothetical protein
MGAPWLGYGEAFGVCPHIEAEITFAYKGIWVSAPDHQRPLITGLIIVSRMACPAAVGCTPSA